MNLQPWFGYEDQNASVNVRIRQYSVVRFGGTHLALGRQRQADL